MGGRRGSGTGRGRGSGRGGGEGAEGGTGKAELRVLQTVLRTARRLRVPCLDRDEVIEVCWCVHRGVCVQCAVCTHCC